MADVQLNKGHFSFANTLWEAIHKYDFPRQEKKLLEEVWRLTYGCKKEKDGSDGRYCIVDEWQQLAAASCLDPGAFSRMLKSLMAKHVLYVSRKYKVIVFNKDPDTWKGVSIFKTYDDKAHKALIKRNLNYSEVDKALGNAMHNEMKKEWQLDAESSDLTESQPEESTDLTQSQVTCISINNPLDAESSETADKSNDDAASDPSKIKDLKENSSSSVTNNTITTGSQEPCQEEEEEFLKKEEAEKEERILYVMKKIEKLWVDLVVQPHTMLMASLEDVAEYPREAIDEAFRAAKKQKVRKGNLNWILERLSNPKRYGLKDYVEEASREEKRRIQDRLRGAGEAINKAYGNDGGWQPYRGTDEDDAVIDSLLVFTTIEAICKSVEKLSKEKVNAPDILPRVEKEFAKF